jgi:hypothetical protein
LRVLREREIESFEREILKERERLRVLRERERKKEERRERDIFSRQNQQASYPKPCW